MACVRAALMLSLAVFVVGCNSSSAVPVAKRVPTSKTMFGVTLTDDYAWLRNKDSPEVQAYLHAEDNYADAVTAPLKDLRAKLFDEMKKRVPGNDDSVPYERDGWLYSTRYTDGNQYAVYHRQHTSKGSTSVPILDVNELARGKEFMQIDEFEPSDDGKLLAFTRDETGFREYKLAIKDLVSGHMLTETAERVSSVAWAIDSKTLFYAIDDDSKRPYRIMRLEVGSGIPAEVVYEEPVRQYNIGIARTRDSRFLILTSASSTTSECSVLETDNPHGKFRLIEARREGVEYYVDHRRGRFYVRTNDTGRNFRLASAPVESPGSANWTDVIPQRADTMIEDVELFRDYIVAVTRREGNQRVLVVDAAQQGAHEIAFPEPSYAVALENNQVFDTDTIRLAYTSLVSPKTVIDYDMRARTREVRKVQQVVGGYDASLYAAERVMARAPDGTAIPVSIVYRKDKAARPMPLLLDGYGSYGIPNDVYFSSSRLSLLDRGVAFAQAHIRGGGEMGKAWHDAGRMMNKQNTFSDFIAVSEFLCKSGYTSPDKLAIIGGSAGGLLMGAVTNMRPDLFKAVVAEVPFVDVMNTMLDDSLPLTAQEYLEWGNPNEEAAFKYMSSYSPYDNLKAQKYPAMLVKTSVNDSQVMYWEPTKLVARLRTLKTDQNPLLLKINFGAGHGGASGRFDALEEEAFNQAFVLWQLGLAK